MHNHECITQPSSNDFFGRPTPPGGDVPDDSGFSPFPGNINILLFSLPRYAQLLDETGGVVPEFVNPKWGNAEKTKLKSSTRLEAGDAAWVGMRIMTKTFTGG